MVSCEDSEQISSLESIVDSTWHPGLGFCLSDQLGAQIFTQYDCSAAVIKIHELKQLKDQRVVLAYSSRESIHHGGRTW